MLERDKAVLEQGQTQLLADYKVAYERAAAQEEAMEVLRGSYIALEHRNAELNAQIESVEALTPEVADNRQQEEAMEVLRASNTALELQNAELRVAAEAAKPEVVESLRQEISSLLDANQQLAATEAELLELKENLLELENLRATERRRVEELETEMAALQEEKVSLFTKQQAVDSVGFITAVPVISPPQPSPLAALFDSPR